MRPIPRSFFLLSLLLSCGEPETTELKYGTFPFQRETLRSISILQTIAQQNGLIDIIIMYRGVYPTQQQDYQLRVNIGRSIRAWTGAVNGYPFPSPVVRAGPSGSHTIIVDSSITRSYAIPEQRTIYLAAYLLNDPMGYPVLLHEFGHLVGLADTYSEAGRQQPIGQPQSVMNSAFSDQLLPDDIAGALAVWDYMRGASAFCRAPYKPGGAYENPYQILFCVP